MSKIKKEKKVTAQFIPSGQKLKEGEIILFTSAYTVDKTSVSQIVNEKDKKGNQIRSYAILGNQVKVNLDVSSEGYVRRCDGSDEKCTIRVWSEAAELDYNYRLAKVSLKNSCNDIIKSLDELPREAIVKLDSRIRHLIEKYG